MAVSLKQLRKYFWDQLSDDHADPQLALARMRNALVAFERREILRSECFDILNKQLNGCGIESIPTPLPDGGDNLADYVNLGDSYIPTMLYCGRTGRFIVSSWAGYYESTAEYHEYERIRDEENEELEARSAARE